MNQTILSFFRLPFTSAGWHGTQASPLHLKDFAPAGDAGEMEVCQNVVKRETRAFRTRLVVVRKDSLMNKLFSLFLLTVLIPSFLFVWGEGGIQSHAFGQSITDAMIEPGDSIGSMVVTTGVEHAPPLGAFCSSSPEGEGSYILDCRAPALASLGIGNIFLYSDEDIGDLEWSDLVWKLSIDGHEVNLESFGTVDYVLPGISQNPSPVRAIFQQGKAWNVILTDLTPGHHTLWVVAESKMGTYTWFVSLDIEPAIKYNFLYTHKRTA